MAITKLPKIKDHLVIPRFMSEEDEFGVHINPQMIGEGFTQSEMTTWDSCPEKWYLGYNHGLHLIGKFAWALVYGNWMHSALEEFYATGGKRWSIECNIPNRKFVSSENLQKEAYWAGVADIQMQLYASYYKNDFNIWQPIQTEEIVDLEFRGVRLKGMIDMPAIFLPDKKGKKSIYIWDHKTTYQINKMIVMGWDFRFQFMFYCWLATRIPKWKDYHIAGFVINAIRKPALKWNEQKESLPSFLSRLQQHMQEEPEKYWYRDKLTMTKESLKHFEEQILGPKIDRIRALMDPKTPEEIKRIFARNKNTDHCISKFGTACEFLAACQNGLKLEKFRYRRREVKHQELTTEAEE